MATTIETYLEYSELAQAAYGSYQEGYLDTDVLTGSDVKFTEKQADNFAKRYEVIATSQEHGIGSGSGFDAVLFGEVDENNNLTGKKILAIRGTESLADFCSDILLTASGVAFDQTSDLNLFYETLLDNNKISSTDNLDVTGHSLGGVLAQVFAATYPNVVSKAYTYNAPGVGGLDYEIYQQFGINPASFPYANITNIYAQEAPEVISGLGTMLGSVVPISIDADSINPLYYHSIDTLTDSLHVYSLLSAISPSSSRDLLTDIMEHAPDQDKGQVFNLHFLR